MKHPNAKKTIFASTFIFLNKVRKFSKKKGIILIFDECTSGFRQNFGGLHLVYGVNPDILILGKALGNGYAINAKDILLNILIALSSSSTVCSLFICKRILAIPLGTTGNENPTA